MNMREQALGELKKIYTFCITEKNHRAGYDPKKWQAYDPAERKDMLAILDYLEDHGLIEMSQVSLGCPVSIKLTTIGIDTIEENVQPQQPIPQAIFNIGENNGVVASSASNFSITNGVDMKTLEKLIHDKLPAEEQEELLYILRQLHSKLEASEPIEKGLLSTVTGHLQKNSWLSSPVAGMLLRYVAGLPL